MNKNFRKTDEVAANQNETMETDTILRKRKTRMRRGNFLRKARIVFLIAGIVLCECASGQVYLLSEISNGSTSKKIEYNKQNRITKITDYSEEKVSAVRTFTYNNVGDFISYKGVFTDNPESNFNLTCRKSGNKIIFYDGEIVYAQIDLNAETLPVKTDYPSVGVFDEYKYLEGNINEWNRCWYESECSGYYAFTYDDKKFPFHYCKTPKWLLVFYGSDHNIKNNVLTHKGSEEYTSLIYTYTYTYNEAGLPLTRKRTVKWKQDDTDENDWKERSDRNETTTYKYEER